MTTTTNLLITHIESSQAQKEVTANDAFNNLDAAIAGRLALSTTGGTTTLTDAQARNAIMDVSGALTSNAVIVVPARSKLYAVRNATSGAFTLTVKTASGTGVMVRQGYQALLFCDGTNVGTATDAQMADHLAAPDPHPQYATDADLSAHTGAATGAHAASAISYTPAGNLAATDVAAALNELDAEKSGLGLANSFTQPQTAPQFNVGDADARIKRTPDGHTQIEATQRSLISAGLLQSQQAANALWDGTNWNRIDTAQPASLHLVDRSGALSFYTAPAAANPIAWNGPYPVIRGGMSHATATLSANQSIAASTVTKVAFATEQVDVLGDYDPALYRFTAPEFGIYDVSASALFTGNADAARSFIAIYYNAAEYRRGTDTVQGGSSDVVATVGTTIRLAAGDYVEIYAYCSAASTLLAYAGVAWLSISRVQ